MPLALLWKSSAAAVATMSVVLAVFAAKVERGDFRGVGGVAAAGVAADLFWRVVELFSMTPDLGREVCSGGVWFGAGGEAEEMVGLLVGVAETRRKALVMMEVPLPRPRRGLASLASLLAREIGIEPTVSGVPMAWGLLLLSESPVSNLLRGEKRPNVLALTVRGETCWGLGGRQIGRGGVVLLGGRVSGEWCGW